jgi:hypothetical protein
VNEDADAEKMGSGVDPLWDRVLAAWDDDKVHSALIEFAVRTENLPDVAGRYRELKDDPEKGERAKKQLNAIVVAATQMMLATKATRPETIKPPWWMTASAAGVCFFLLMLLMYALLRRH